MPPSQSGTLQRKALLQPLSDFHQSPCCASTKGEGGLKNTNNLFKVLDRKGECNLNLAPDKSGKKVSVMCLHNRKDFKIFSFFMVSLCCC